MIEIKWETDERGTRVFSFGRRFDDGGQEWEYEAIRYKSVLSRNAETPFRWSIWQRTDPCHSHVRISGFAATKKAARAEAEAAIRAVLAEGPCDD